MHHYPHYEQNSQWLKQEKLPTGEDSDKERLFPLPFLIAPFATLGK